MPQARAVRAARISDMSLAENCGKAQGIGHGSAVGLISEHRERLVRVTARLGHDDADRVVDHGPRLQGLFELCGQVAGLEVAAYHHDGGRSRHGEQGDKVFIQLAKAVRITAGQVERSQSSPR